MDTNLLDDGPVGRTIEPPTPEQSLLAHLTLGRAAYEENTKQRQMQYDEYRAPWDDLTDEIRYAWAIAAWAVLSRAVAAQDHEAAIMRCIAEPSTQIGDEPPPLLPPPPMK